MAGSASDYLENAMLALVFNNSNIANMGDATGVRGSLTAGSFFIALFTTVCTDAAPGTETVYTNYTRTPLARTTGGFAISGTTPTKALNVATVSFPPCGATGATIVAFAIMDALTGGNMLYFGTCSLAVSTAITPNFPAGSLEIDLD